MPGNDASARLVRAVGAYLDDMRPPTFDDLEEAYLEALAALHGKCADSRDTVHEESPDVPRKHTRRCPQTGE